MSTGNTGNDLPKIKLENDEQHSGLNNSEGSLWKRSSLSNKKTTASAKRSTSSRPARLEAIHPAFSNDGGPHYPAGQAADSMRAGMRMRPSREEGICHLGNNINLNSTEGQSSYGMSNSMNPAGQLKSAEAAQRMTQQSLGEDGTCLVPSNNDNTNIVAEETNPFARFQTNRSQHELVPGTKIHLSALHELARRKEWISVPTFQYGLIDRHIENLLHQGRSVGLNLEKPYIDAQNKAAGSTPLAMGNRKGGEATTFGSSSNPFVLDDGEPGHNNSKRPAHDEVDSRLDEPTGEPNKKRKTKEASKPSALHARDNDRTIAKVWQPIGNYKLQKVFELTKSDIEDLKVNPKSMAIIYSLTDHSDSRRAHRPNLQPRRQAAGRLLHPLEESTRGVAKGGGARF